MSDVAEEIKKSDLEKFLLMAAEFARQDIKNYADNEHMLVFVKGRYAQTKYIAQQFGIKVD